MRHQAPGAHRRQKPPAALGRLAGPQHLRHRPAGQGPGELLVARQTAALVDQLEGLVGHRRSIAVHHAAGQVRKADVEVRLGNDDHLFQLGPTRGIFGPCGNPGQHQPRPQQKSSRETRLSGSAISISHGDILCVA
jgi:hypothetical protein